MFIQKSWLLGHIKKSFIYTDDSGMSDSCLHRSDESHWLREANNELSDSEEEDARRQMSDFDQDDGGASRFRCNTTVRLEKLKNQQKEASETKIVKWKNPLGSAAQGSPFKPRRIPETLVTRSRLTDLLENAKTQEKQPFEEFKKFDGKVQQGVPSKKIQIYVPGNRGFPINVCVTNHATVRDLIGLTCYLWVNESDYDGPIPDPEKLELCLADDDGSPELDFPPWEKTEAVTRFSFNTFAVSERKHVK
ncbi:stress-activated map kinase-interacting protein 1-like isoform X2 [Artemia franciscana]|uniref:CRIM domain-containing protein n=2 Tax=Artemia franciscana TaxID=6661 RepID=A0AA88KXJ2_ARTSF|nr:hypothetical protein QYM36_015863 [Artemia franciscana]KAK2705612.1 hypothetical protein QYM36_015863 [Artemia franciscana]KAK2705613.1 hypothetical protein QYM36_015863 [Artemia franciscana]